MFMQFSMSSQEWRHPEVCLSNSTHSRSPKAVDSYAQDVREYVEIQEIYRKTIDPL